jgi:RIO kinase 2
MSQIFRAAHYVKDMIPEDFRVLTGIELGMRRFTYVPLEQVSFYCRYTRSETQFYLDKLHKMGILQRNSQVGYIGYQLISESYDILALHALVEKDQIVAIGDSIGRGKESDVFYGKEPDGTQVSVKIHRIGQRSFRKIRKLRSYVQNRRHISWLYVSRLSAEAEYQALEKLKPLCQEGLVNIPMPIAQNRHMVVMDLIHGEELSLINKLENPIEIIDEILRQVENMFLKAKIIHCDLSEFNILISPENKVFIIDWPQWEAADHPNAQSYLARDLTNIHSFFKRNFGVTFDIDEFLDRMFGEDRPPLLDQ